MVVLGILAVCVSLWWLKGQSLCGRWNSCHHQHHHYHDNHACDIQIINTISIYKYFSNRMFSSSLCQKKLLIFWPKSEQSDKDVIPQHLCSALSSLPQSLNKVHHRQLYMKLVRTYFVQGLHEACTEFGKPPPICSPNQRCELKRDPGPPVGEPVSL